ncbi:MAG: hypothetical protein OHK0029_08330 [Armatimonadaceae bacterium]
MQQQSNGSNNRTAVRYTLAVQRNRRHLVACLLFGLAWVVAICQVYFPAMQPNRSAPRPVSSPTMEKTTGDARPSLAVPFAIITTYSLTAFAIWCSVEANLREQVVLLRDGVKLEGVITYRRETGRESFDNSTTIPRYDAQCLVFLPDGSAAIVMVEVCRERYQRWQVGTTVTAVAHPTNHQVIRMPHTLTGVERIG